VKDRYFRLENLPSEFLGNFDSFWRGLALAEGLQSTGLAEWIGQKFYAIGRHQLSYFDDHVWFG